MKIECFFSEGCGSKEEVKENIQKAIHEEGIETEIYFREISQEEAGRLGISGSPTVWINGKDVEPGIPHGGFS